MLRPCLSTPQSDRHRFDDVFSLGIFRIENEIKNDLVIFWIFNNGEIDGWIGRFAFVEHTYLGGDRVIDIDPRTIARSTPSVGNVTRLTRRQIFLLVIVRLGCELHENR